MLIAAVGIAKAKPTEEDASRTDISELIKKAKELLTKIDRENGVWSEKVSYAEWNYASNLTEENLANKLAISKQAAKYNKEMWKEVNAIDWHRLPDENLKRQFSKLSVLGVSALPEKVRFSCQFEYFSIIFIIEPYLSKKICFQIASFRELSMRICMTN